MNLRFNYTNKERKDFLADVVKPMIKRRKDLGLTQEDIDNKLGVADRLVSKWECGLRTPTSFHLYCWADALNGSIFFKCGGNLKTIESNEDSKHANENNNYL